MHLEKRPTYFVKNGVRKPVYYTVDARQLAEAGWVPEENKPNPIKPIDEPVAVAINEPIDKQQEPDSESEESAAKLSDMTKVELVEFAKERNIQIDPYALKSTVLETIEAAIGG